MAALVSSLFSPFHVKNLELANRIVMSPMTRSHSPGGVPSEDVVRYYARRAENDVGLIITEGTVVDHPSSANDLNVPQFFGTEALAGWRCVAEAVHAAGGRIIPQLWHVGSVRNPAVSPNPDVPSVGPSGLRKRAVAFGDPMSESAIADVIASFARAASAAIELGFDGIELHGGHGYLLDQFFWEVTNSRPDRFGGDLAGRCRFAAEIIKACRAAIGSEYPIFLRFSQWKVQDYKAKLVNSPQELEAFLSPLIDAGVDVFHCSTRRFWVPEFEGSPLNLAGWAKRVSGKPVVTVGSVGLDSDMLAAFRGESAAVVGIDAVVEMIARQEVDLVAVGRALLADYRWARKILERRESEILPFTPDAMKILT